ncbi:MAG: hypothetical protein EU533_07650, partial [Promethearchaeota archaeon]
MITSNNRKTKRSIVLIMTIILSVALSVINFNPKVAPVNNNTDRAHSDKNSLSSASLSNFDWFNDTWEFRICVNVSANGASQNNVPIELKMNFTEYLYEINIFNTELDTNSIRVIEYTSISNFIEIPSEFHPYADLYNNNTNAIGDLVWIMNGTTEASEFRTCFAYFNNNESKEVAPAPSYSTIRKWHEGFEEMEKSDGLILRAAGTSQDVHYDLYDISTDISGRGDRSLQIWGNCWKAIDIGYIEGIDSDTYVTVRMRITDPGQNRDISGIAFDSQYWPNLPSQLNTYEMRGWQDWGRADAPAPYGPFDDNPNYYDTDTFYWYTLNLDDEISASSFRYIIFVADWDTHQGYDLFWDDLSIWKQPVQTDPNNLPSISVGELEAKAYTLKVICVDEEGNRIENANIFLSNSIDPSANQNHLTNEDGEWLFTEINSDLDYNITVNYTQHGLPIPKTETVYFKEDYEVTSLNNVHLAYLNLTTINFNVTDYDGDPIKYGFVKLKDGDNDVGESVLNDAGECTIIWKNETNYKFDAYFDFNSVPDPISFKYNELKISNGTVNIGTHDIDVPTYFTKVFFNVTQRSDGTPFAGAKLRIYNTTDFNQKAKILANITIQIDGSARFFGFNNQSTGGWGNYTLEVYFAGQERIFYINEDPLVNMHYNFSLHTQLDLDISVDLDMSKYNSTLNYIDSTGDVYWGDSITIDFSFYTQDPSSPEPTYITPEELYFQILDDEQGSYSSIVSILSSETSEGFFSYQFNTNDFSLTGGYHYWIEITGEYKSYISPDPLQVRFEVITLPTALKIYNYSLDELIDNEVIEYYDEIVNITVDFYDNNTNISLEDADITYDWDYGNGVLIDDPIHIGYYYFEFNTSKAPGEGYYIIDITAALTNHSTSYDSFLLNILPRRTLLNGTSRFFQITREVYIKDTKIFKFEYVDTVLDTIVSEADITGYTWYRLGEDGNPLSGPDNEGTGYLLEDEEGCYVLDFNTETKAVGEYSLFVTLKKHNYEFRNAYINLKIILREFEKIFDATGLESNNQIMIGQGEDINFEIDLNDLTRDGINLENASITLSIGDNIYEFNETSPGRYILTFTTDDVDTFFAPKTYTGTINISAT